jgi:hypothetical protein
VDARSIHPTTGFVKRVFALNDNSRKHSGKSLSICGSGSFLERPAAQRQALTADSRILIAARDTSIKFKIKNFQFLCALRVGPAGRLDSSLIPS